MSEILIKLADPAMEPSLKSALEQENPALNYKITTTGAPAQNAITIGEAEAADALPVPLRFGRLLDRLQRFSAQEKKLKPVKIGPYEFQPWIYALRKAGGTDIRLTEKETHILEFLLGQKDRRASKDSLLEQVWGYAETVETHTLETHIYRLRQKIETDPTNPKILVTDNQEYCLKING